MYGFADPFPLQAIFSFHTFISIFLQFYIAE